MSIRIAFVGVGRMGANMARCLHEKGYSIVAVHDAHRESAIALGKEIEATVPDKLSEVTASADVIFTVVSDDRAMRSIFKGGKDNLLSGKTRGKIFVNCATVSPSVHLEVEALCKAHHALSIEACMASSIPQAREGKLFLMVAGERKTFAKVEPILADISKSMRYIGKTGSAAQVKALVNMVMNMNTAALAEGLALGDALGIDLTLLREIFSVTGANSRVLETDGEDMQNREHDCYFSAAHAAKDSGIAAALAKSQKLQLPLNAATLAQYRKMVKKNLGHLDKSGIAELTFRGRGN
jgi:3-hydroxyisobutyrate dehydrogenase